MSTPIDAYTDALVAEAATQAAREIAKQAATEAYDEAYRRVFADAYDEQLAWYTVHLSDAVDLLDARR